jgi:hypothetical protein
MMLLLLALLAAPAAGGDAALEAALAGVRPASLRADLGWLASDELRGRETPSPELELAALYLRNRVERLGFRPGAGESWFHEYPLHSWWLDAGDSAVLARGPQGDCRLAFGRDYYFQLGRDAVDLDLEGGVVCVGDADEELLARLELEGRWALVLDTGRTLRKKLAACFEAGAAGALVTPGPDYRRDPYAEKYGRRAAALLEPSRPSPEAREGDGEPTPPVVMLPRGSAARLVALAGAELAGGHPAPGAVLDLVVRERRRVARRSTPVKNVCALWPGADPELSREVMIVSAHYDHVGTGDEGEVFNGADDNASGTTGVLAVADALAAHGPLERSVLLLWVSGEEKGLWGSAAWTRDPWLPEGWRAVLDVNIDMIGRTGPEELYLTPSREHEAFNQVAEAAYRLAPLEGFPTLESQDEYWRRSDHMNFNDNLGVPVVFLSTGDHPDYHRPSDTAEKIDHEKSARVVRLVVRLLAELDAAPAGSITR